MLMIPGPSEPEPEVLSALALPVLPHYGEEWKRIYDETTSKLQKVFRTTNGVIIVPIPGQLAVEMAVANLVPKGQEAYVCVNGSFSKAIVEMIRYLGGKPIEITSKLGSAATAEQVAKVVEESKDSSGKPLFVVHNETGTGAVSPAEDIFRVCKKHGVITVLDAISSFGGIDVRVDEWKVDYAIGYASKGLGGVFGALPVALSQEVWEIAKRNEGKIHTRFLNLNVWEKAIAEMGPWGHPHPSSMPTSAIVGMGVAVDLVLKEGLDNRFRRHREVAQFTRTGLEKLGLPMFPEKGLMSNTVSVVRVDRAWERELRQQMLQKYDIMIGGGLGELSGKVVRLGHMGRSASFQRVSTTLTVMESILKDVRRR
jgi:alanine-glyoxylate transaminase/serine-glyoxylate transaminase/serine-pyruvate transaminase